MTPGAFRVKSCGGCRHLFEDVAIDGKPHEFCRAMPPPMTTIQSNDKREYFTSYPLAPRVRCGQYARRWWSRLAAAVTNQL